MRYLGFIWKKIIPISYYLDSFYLAQFLAQKIDNIANTLTQRTKVNLVTHRDEVVAYQGLALPASL